MGNIQDGQSLAVSMVNPATGKPQTIGIFSDVTIGFAYGSKPVYILGASAPQRIQRTHQEPVTVRFRAWREAEHGPFVDGMLPKLQDILTNPTTTLSLIDRNRLNDPNLAGNATTAELTGLVITGFDETTTIRDLKEYTVTGMAIMYRDESAQNAEAPNATSLP